MATLPEIETALRNADAAGDAEAARALAAEVVRLRGGNMGRSAFDMRFEGEAPQAAPNPKLQEGLQRVARAKTTGPQAGLFQRMLTDFTNQGRAAGQLTTPDIESHYPNLVSADVHRADSGELMYRDATGQMLPIDRNQHVVLRDPTDSRVKVFRRTDETNASQLEAGGRILSTGMGAGAPTARPGLPAAARADKIPRAAETAATAKPYYQAFDAAAGDSFVPPAQVVDRVFAALEKGKQPRHLVDEVYRTVDGVRGKDGAEIPLSRIRDLKEEIGASFKSPDKRVRAAAAIATREVNKIIGEIDPAAGRNLKVADDIYSASQAQQRLENLEKIAGLRTGRAGYGGNAVNNMRQVLSPVVQKAIEGRKTGFRPDEIAAMQEIIEGTTATNLLRGVGQLSPSKGIFASGMMVGTAGLSAALGAAANKLATILTRNQIVRLQELVAKRSPAYAEAVSKAVSRYDAAQAAFASRPSPANLAKYIQASRALSSGLTRDGIQMSSGDLLRAIQGSMRTAAEDEQPEAPRGVNQ